MRLIDKLIKKINGRGKNNLPTENQVFPNFQIRTPTPTLPIQYQELHNTTINFLKLTPDSSTMETLDAKPLSIFLKKRFPWIIEVTEVTYRNKNNPFVHSVIRIHIIVNATHYVELMDPKIEKLVIEKLNEILKPLLVSMYSVSHEPQQTIVFFPEYSETILELL